MMIIVLGYIVDGSMAVVVRCPTSPLLVTISIEDDGCAWASRQERIDDKFRGSSRLGIVHKWSTKWVRGNQTGQLDHQDSRASG